MKIGFIKYRFLLQFLVFAGPPRASADYTDTTEEKIRIQRLLLTLGMFGRQLFASVLGSEMLFSLARLAKLLTVSSNLYLPVNPAQHAPVMNVCKHRRTRGDSTCRRQNQN